MLMERSVINDQFFFKREFRDTNPSQWTTAAEFAWQLLSETSDNARFMENMGQYGPTYK
jgi:hypothetical protein